jgi:hypothetical protein
VAEPRIHASLSQVAPSAVTTATRPSSFMQGNML